MIHETHDATTPSTEQLYEDLVDNEPKLVSLTVASNAAEAKQAFLAGERLQPQHVYERMEAFDSDSVDTISNIRQQLNSNESLSSVNKEVYVAFADNYAKKATLVNCMNAYRNCEEGEKVKTAEDFMRLNIELYGAPEYETYMSLLQDELSKASIYSADSTAAKLCGELKSTLEISDDSQSAERFVPSTQTQEWMQEVASELYGGMMSYLPDKESVTAKELQQAWGGILKNEFGGAADDWQVVLEPAKAINVRASEKKIIIPEERKDLSIEDAKGLTAHEVGVHAYRSITGESTDVGPLAHGLSEYYDTEEGLGLVMEQSVKGRYREAGVGHYITAGMVYFHNLDFRQTFEMRWRLNALDKADAEGDISDESIEAARGAAYNQTMRILRGTDELPWFKDLAYYNGAQEVWRYIEKHCGDEFMLSLLLQGKRGTTREHQRVVLESRSIA